MTVQNLRRPALGFDLIDISAVAHTRSGALDAAASALSSAVLQQLDKAQKVLHWELKPVLMHSSCARVFTKHSLQTHEEYMHPAFLGSEVTWASRLVRDLMRIPQWAPQALSHACRIVYKATAKHLQFPSQCSGITP
jgi:hypothetical protein